jgi:hypothetical protein
MGVEVAGTDAPDEKEAPAEEDRAVEKRAPAKKAKAEEKPYWQQHLEDGSADRSRTAAAIILTIIVAIVVLSAVLVVYLVRPQPRTVYSELSVGQYDVTYSASTPSGDNKSALVPIEIKITNKGEGTSGVVLVFCEAFNSSNPNQKASGFNTSELRDLNNNVSNKIPPKGKPGCIVRVNGMLNLTPGSYNVRLEIYEDAKTRTLVSGSFIVNVDKSMVATPQPYVPEQGSGRGKSSDIAPATGSLPGFEGPAALVAVAAILVLVRLRRKTA